ncbi:MAG: lysozyme inhibitor LprI family protein [Mesorhizobium sp.]|jgi:uncharacterized protein YecT (DUF1311 family)
MHRAALAFMLAVAVVPAAAAQECDRADESQTGMNICAGSDFKEADDKLNRTYSAILKRLGDDAEGKKRLQAAQRSWIAFRDGECAFANGDSRDGSIYPMLMAQCLEGLTTSRDEQLERYLSCEEGDLSCPVPAQ